MPNFFKKPAYAAVHTTPVNPIQPLNEADPVAFAINRLNFHPDPHQAAILRSTSPRGILNCTRQWGKSTVCAAKAVHRAYTQPNSLVLVASPTERQSAEFIRKASGLVQTLGLTPRGDGDNKVSLLFPNNSRLVGLPGLDANIRGFSAVSLLIIDEAAQVRDAMYRALRPMLAVGAGDLWLMSTPFGKRGFFYSTWAHETTGWHRLSVPATECPRIPAQFLAEERAQLGEWFRQEYLCEFIDNGSSVFPRDLVDGALDPSVLPLFPKPAQLWHR